MFLKFSINLALSLREIVLLRSEDLQINDQLQLLHYQTLQQVCLFVLQCKNKSKNLALTRI